MLLFISGGELVLSMLLIIPIFFAGFYAGKYFESKKHRDN